MSNKNVDLQAVSISVEKPELKVGEFTKVEVILKNNGPDSIPKADATCQITLPATYLGKPSRFKSLLGKQWSLLGTITTLGKNGQHNMFFQNNAGPIPLDNSKTFGFTFFVKGKKATAGEISLTLASSLSGLAMSSDVNGTNQSVSAQLVVKK